MSTATPDLTARVITHHGLEALTGPKTRERWQKSELFPPPFWVRADRAQLGIYPEPVLVRVAVGPRNDPSEDEALRRLNTACERLYGGEGFRSLAEVARGLLRELDRTWSFGLFVRILAEREPDILGEVNREVQALELELRENGFVFGVEPGRIVEVESGRYRVQLREGELALPLRCAVEPLQLGADVVVDRVGLGAVEGKFLLPAVEHAIDIVQLESEEKEGAMLGKDELQSLPDRLAAIATRERSSAREHFGIRDVFDSREQFDRGFIPARHVSGDPLPDSSPTSALKERVGAPAFR